MAGGQTQHHPIPDQVTLHATTVAVDGRATMIVGAAGRGKSTLALQLMAYGAQLVCDDRTCITRAGDALWASAPEPITGLIEARGVGLLKADAAAKARLCLVIDMDQTESGRLPPAREHVIAGVALPCLHKVDSPGFPAAVLQYLKAGRRDPS